MDLPTNIMYLCYCFSSIIKTTKINSCLWLPECASQYTDNVAILVVSLLHFSRCNFLKVNISPCKGDTFPYFSKEAFLLTGS